MGFLSLTRLGTEFVILFFVLSGFSIAHSLRVRPRLKDFYLRRIIRLYPVYIVALSWAIAVFLITKNWRPDFYSNTYDFITFNELAKMNDFLSPKILLGNLFYLPNGILVSPFWSLTYEVIFYLLAPFVLRNRRAYYFISVLLFLLSLVIYGVRIPYANPLLAYILSYNVFFMIGIALYDHWERAKAILTLKKSSFWSILALIFLACVAFNVKWGGISKVTAAAFALAACLMIVNFQIHRFRPKVLRMLGAASYTIYVSHYPTIILVLALVHEFIPPPYIFSKTVWILSLPVALGVATVFYHLVEKPTKLWLERLRRR